MMKDLDAARDAIRALELDEPQDADPVADPCDELYRVICGRCGDVQIGQAEYRRQMLLPDELWQCPECGEAARFNDDVLERAIPDEPPPDAAPMRRQRERRTGSLGWRLRHLTMLAPSTVAFRARTVGEALTDAAAHAAGLRCRLREARSVADTEEALAVLSEDFAAPKNDQARSAHITLRRHDETGLWHQAEIVVDDLARQLAEAEVRIDGLARRHREALAELESAAAELRFLAGEGA